MSGELQAGDAIPSMRALAKSIHVSVITVQKAYEDLQRDGFIETTVVRGSFVSAQNKEFYQGEQYGKYFRSATGFQNIFQNQNFHWKMCLSTCRIGQLWDLKDNGKIKLFGKEMFDANTAMREKIDAVYDRNNFPTNWTAKQLAGIMA